MPKRAAIYLRVSSDKQTVENQRPEVEQLARARGFEVVHVYEEQASAVKHRPQYEAMLKDARRGTFGAVVCWALDRFGRSMVGNLQDVLELDQIGVEVVSVREPWLDTGGPVRTLLIGIFSWCAEQERNRLVSRTRLGLDRARRQGSSSAVLAPRWTSSAPVSFELGGRRCGRPPPIWGSGSRPYIARSRRVVSSRA